jgi:nitroimidazol reductase NimA-like FMN-containing flavoprotein (pyridoxamine 5'-phosphate oxidase superfamily)
MRPVDADPAAEIDSRFSSPGAAPTPWPIARTILEKAEIYWLSTVRPDGRPHVTPLAAVWHDNAIVFCTGPTERKARNLEYNRDVVFTTGCNTIEQGTDVVIEGKAEPVIDDAKLRELADAYVAKYGEVFRFEVREQAFYSADGGRALVFEVKPRKGFAFGKGDAFSQTRWFF